MAPSLGVFFDSAFVCFGSLCFPAGASARFVGLEAGLRLSPPSPKPVGNGALTAVVPALAAGLHCQRLPASSASMSSTNPGALAQDRAPSRASRGPLRPQPAVPLRRPCHLGRRALAAVAAVVRLPRTCSSLRCGGAGRTTTSLRWGGASRNLLPQRGPMAHLPRRP